MESKVKGRTLEQSLTWLATVRGYLTLDWIALHIKLGDLDHDATAGHQRVKVPITCFVDGVFVRMVGAMDDTTTSPCSVHKTPWRKENKIRKRPWSLCISYFFSLFFVRFILWKGFNTAASPNVKATPLFPIKFQTLYNAVYYDIISMTSARYRSDYELRKYHQTSNIGHTKSQNLNVSYLVLQLSLPNPLKPKMKM